MLKEEDYSSSGTLMQTARCLKYSIIKGRCIPVVQVYVDEFEKGNMTKVEIRGVSTKNLDRRIFTKAYLEDLSK